jgi:hypothetical protein
VAPRRRETELSVERPLGPEGTAGGTVRLSVRLEPGSDGAPPAPGEIAEVLESLKSDLDALLGPSLAALPAVRSDRDTVELVESYRPRQRELVDLLRDEGEITSVEHGRLVEYLSTGPAAARPPAPTPPPAKPIFDQPIAAVPILAERGSESTRPVADLLQQYQITSLKQAGAVRARRQISFEEYMSLKRHFQHLESAPAPSST